MSDDIAESDACMIALGQWLIAYMDARQRQADFDHIDAIRVGFRAGYEYGRLS